MDTSESISLRDIEFAKALLQHTQQSHQPNDPGSDHAGTTLSELAIMAGSMDQRSREPESGRQEYEMDEQQRQMDDVAFATGGVLEGMPGQEEMDRVTGHEMDYDHSPLEISSFHQPSHISEPSPTTGEEAARMSEMRMILIPAQFQDSPHMEEFREEHVQEYLRMRAREFVFLKHTEKRNESKLNKKPLEEEQSNSNYVDQNIDPSFSTSTYPYTYSPSLPPNLSPLPTATSQSPTLDAPRTVKGKDRRKFGGPLQYEWIAEYRCCFSGKHRERAHVSVTGMKRKRAASTKVGCKAKFLLRKVIKTGLVEATYHWQHNGHDPADPTELNRARKNKINADLKGLVWGTPVPLGQEEIDLDRLASEGKESQGKRKRAAPVRGTKRVRRVEKDDTDLAEATGLEPKEGLASGSGSGLLSPEEDYHSGMREEQDVPHDATLAEHLEGMDRSHPYSPQNAGFELSQSRSSQQTTQNHGDFSTFERGYENGQGGEGYGIHSGPSGMRDGFGRASQQTSDLRTTGSRQETDEAGRLDPSLQPPLDVEEAIAANTLDPVMEDASASGRRPEIILAEAERSYQDMGRLLVTAQRALEDVRRSGQSEDDSPVLQEIWRRYDESTALHKRLEAELRDGGLLPGASAIGKSNEAERADRFL